MLIEHLAYIWKVRPNGKKIMRKTPPNNLKFSYLTLDTTSLFTMTIFVLRGSVAAPGATQGRYVCRILMKTEHTSTPTTRTSLSSHPSPGESQLSRLFYDLVSVLLQDDITSKEHVRYTRHAFSRTHGYSFAHLVLI